MKNYSLYLVLLLSILLTACPNSDKGEIIQDFEPVEITFTDDFFTDCNQVKTINGARISYRLSSENEACSDRDPVGECGLSDHVIFEENRQGHPFLGEYGIFLGNHLEVDLSQVEGASKVILTIDDNCSVGCTRANLYRNGQVISTTSNTTVREVEDFVFDIDEGNEKVTVFSCEGVIYKITIE